VLRQVTFDSTDFKLYSNPEQLKAGTLLKTGNAYDLQTIIAERNRISGLFQNDGYYLLDANRIIVRVDTNLNSQEANLHVRLKDEFRSQYSRRFKIGEVNIYTSFSSVEGIQPDTVKMDLNSIRNTGLSIYENNRYFKPRIFEESIVFRK